MKITKLVRSVIMALCAIVFAVNLSAQDSLANGAGDNITGTYSFAYKGEITKIRVSKTADGAYTAQVFWVKNRLEKDGKVRKDDKNPDKALRNIDCDKIVLIKGMKYNASEKVWDSAQIYDPLRGMKGNLTAWFKDSKTLALKGSKMGFSETVYWTKL